MASGRPVVVQDVTRDARYLATIGGTRAEMIVPVLEATGGTVVGTIDVESAEIDAFGPRDDALLHAAALLLRPLWR